MTSSLTPLRTATLLVIALGLCSLNLGASPITFSTSGVFTCAGCSGSGSNSVTFLGGQGNAFMLTFTGLGATSLNTPTGTSLGNFQTFFSGSGPINASGTFTLTVTQTAPTGGSDSFSSTYSG